MNINRKYINLILKQDHSKLSYESKIQLFKLLFKSDSLEDYYRCNVDGLSIHFEHYYPLGRYYKNLVRFEKTMLYNLRALFKNECISLIFTYHKRINDEGWRYSIKSFSKLYEINK